MRTTKVSKPTVSSCLKYTMILQIKTFLFQQVYSSKVLQNFFLGNIRRYKVQAVLHRALSHTVFCTFGKIRNPSSSSSVARQPCVGLGLPQKLPPFLSVQCYAPPIPNSQRPYVRSDTVFSSHLRSSNFPGLFWYSLKYLLHCSLVTSTQYMSSPLQPFDLNTQ